MDGFTAQNAVQNPSSVHKKKTTVFIFHSVIKKRTHTMHLHRLAPSLRNCAAKGIKRTAKRNKTNNAVNNKKKGEGNGRTIMFQSLGCPRNFVDSEVMLGYSVRDGGMVPAATEADGGTSNDPDVVVINTCGFLEKAREESRSAIAGAIERRRQRDTTTAATTATNAAAAATRRTKLIVTGCMANLPEQRDRILRDFPGIDAVLPSGDIDKIVDTIRSLDGDVIDSDRKKARAKSKKKAKKEAKRSREKSPSTPSTTIPSSRSRRKSFLEKGDTPRFLATPPHYAYLKIAEGCRKRCAFCVIPKLKGRLRSKPVPQVVEEFKAVVEHGTAREVVLIAQDLGDYGYDFRTGEEKRKSHLVQLVEAILSSMNDDGDGDDSLWIRLLYLYPDEITPDLIDLMKDDKRIARYLDLPIQHSHDDMLRAMRRKTDSKHIKDTIAALRRDLPDISIRTSLMVGFPGETEEHFEDLLRFVREHKLDHVGVFKYSNEEMAHSSRMDGQVPEDVKQDRYLRLMEEQWKVVEERHKRRVSRSERMLVVVEGLREEEEEEELTGNLNNDSSKPLGPPRIVGRHSGQCPEIDGQVILEGQPRVYAGERYWVEIVGYEGYDLIGRVLSEED